MSDFEARLKQLEEKVEKQARELNTQNRNMKFLRELLQEAIGLTENTSGIVVEHYATADKRMNEAGEIFTSRIVRQLEAKFGPDILEKLKAIEVVEVDNDGNIRIPNELTVEPAV